MFLGFMILSEALGLLGWDGLEDPAWSPRHIITFTTNGRMDYTLEAFFGLPRFGGCCARQTGVSEQYQQTE